jgi:hypothetical protein
MFTFLKDCAFSSYLGDYTIANSKARNSKEKLLIKKMVEKKL